MCVCLSFYLSVFVILPKYLSVCLSFKLSVCHFICHSVRLSFLLKNVIVCYLSNLLSIHPSMRCTSVDIFAKRLTWCELSSEHVFTYSIWLQTSLDGSVLLGLPPGLRMRRCSCWSNSGLCHYAISEWDGIKQHTVHSNQQANQSKPQVCYCHSEIGQSQEGFSCWSFSLFIKALRHPIKIIIKKLF